MKLYFFGHNERYAVEQSLLSLFPDERPLYPEDTPGGEEELELHYRQGKYLDSASALLRRNGQLYRAQVRCKHPPEEADAVLCSRLRRRLLQRAFYRVGVAALGVEPPWGMLSGVRPVKLPVRAILGGASNAAAARMLQKEYHVSPRRVSLAMDCAKAALAVQATLQEDEICLYLGIPFCPTRCAYCSFISAAEGNGRLIPPYLDALHAELRQKGAQVRAEGRSVRSVYLGGGTPTTLEAAQLSALLTDIHEHFPLRRGAELTVEAGRPDTITREKLTALRDGGTTRLSLNPQSLSDEVLRAIGRAHSVADFYAAWEAVKAVGFQRVNMDLIAGLPCDSLAGFAQSLDGVLALRPENITVHTLALKRGSRLATERLPLPTATCVAAMLDYAWSRLRAAGYLPYYLYRQKYSAGGFENIAWCLPGQESDYNICMMEELCSIVSLGAGGVSKQIDYAAGSLIRSANPKYPQEYIRAKQG